MGSVAWSLRQGFGCMELPEAGTRGAWSQDAGSGQVGSGVSCGVERGAPWGTRDLSSPGGEGLGSVCPQLCHWLWLPRCTLVRAHMFTGAPRYPQDRGVEWARRSEHNDAPTLEDPQRPMSCTVSVPAFLVPLVSSSSFLSIHLSCGPRTRPPSIQE